MNDKEEKRIRLLKQAHIEDDGNYAMMGMMHQCSSYLNIDYYSDQVLEIVERYLEHIGYCTFFEYLRSKEVNNYIKNGKW